MIHISTRNKPEQSSEQGLSARGRTHTRAIPNAWPIVATLRLSLSLLMKSVGARAAISSTATSGSSRHLTITWLDKLLKSRNSNQKIFRIASIQRNNSVKNGRKGSKLQKVWALQTKYRTLAILDHLVYHWSAKKLKTRTEWPLLAGARLSLICIRLGLMNFLVSVSHRERT